MEPNLDEYEFFMNTSPNNETEITIGKGAMSVLD